MVGWRLHVRASICAAVLSALLAGGSPLSAAAVLPQVAIVAQEAETMLKELAHEVRMEALSDRWAARTRDKVGQAIDSYAGVMRDIDRELARLQASPGENADLIAGLEEAKTSSQNARERLITLNSIMKDTPALKRAHQSGFLERAFTETAAAVARAGKQVEETHRALGEVGSGDWQVGFVEFREIEILEGELEIYMYDKVAGYDAPQEVEVTVGRPFPVRQLPIRFRVCVQDKQKKRLRQMKQRGGTGTIQFLETEGAEGHVFAYQGEPGTTTWTARESYTFEKDSTVDANAAIRAIGQASSDGSTDPDHGDILEIHTNRPVAQNLTFWIEGEVLHWERESRLHRTTKGEVPAEEGTARARIVLSLFPQ